MTADTLTSWGHYPPGDQIPHPCYWRDDLAKSLAQLKQSQGSTLPFGNGRSYGDSCQAESGHVLYARTLDRCLAADWQTGIFTAESGVMLNEVLDIALPRGWFLPVTPGTKYVTLGGAVANDVHGKNHHARGTFGCHVRCFGLVRSDRPPLICSREENPEFFAATIGGLGLTGVIAWVELQLMPVKSGMIDMTTTRFGGLSDFFALSREFNTHHEYTVAWVDCLAAGLSAGRGIFSAGNHSQKGGLTIKARPRLSAPLTPPFSLVNRHTLKLFNTIYYSRHGQARAESSIDYDRFLYPLDNILNWNRIYGRRGFQQYQCIIPDRDAESAMQELLRIIATANGGSFLAVMKQYGSMISPGLLSFPLQGASLALDFPQHESLNTDLFPRMDAVVREAKGRLYPAKDAHMSGADFRGFYPHWEKLDSLRDPALASRFWNRVSA
jgi:FAD/FMN-containing dehydrogenase